MPSGMAAFQRKQQQRESQRAAQDAVKGTYTNDFRIFDGETHVVRFLEQGPDLRYEETHRIPLVGKTGQYYKNFICLNSEGDGTPCPACQHPNRDIAKQNSRGYVNLIWRNAPVFQRDENKRMVKVNGKPVLIGQEDQIALWNCSWTVYEMLVTKDQKYKGLQSRDWEISRTGSTMNDTAYHIEPADPDAGAVPMSIADMMLAEKKYNLDEVCKKLAFQDFAQVLVRGATPNGPQPTFDRSAAMPPTAASTFADGPQVRSSAFNRG